ncbi:MAG: ribosome biogenesis GTPase Der [Gemmataceae bacterium]
MALPIVAIVGRPNVGKSSLFNMLAGRRISIVDPTAGVTRDRITTTIDVEGHFFDLMDTGGMGIVDTDNLTEDVERQIQTAIESASLILFVVDIRDGVVPLDQHVAERLRILNKPVIFVANKADEDRLDANAPELFRLGWGAPILVSANSKRGQMELAAAIREALPQAGTEAPRDPAIKVAIVGRRNVGKSTFINAVAEADRVIVSEVPGTTRDSIDVRFERGGTSYLAIDTAGVRKRTSLANNIEFYSLHRAERSIRRADVVLHFMDARMRIGRVDKQLAEYILENHKPAVFVINKWDLVRHAMETERMADYIRKVFPMLDYVPIAFVTAKQGKNAIRVLNLASQLHKQSGYRIPTGELNRILRAAMDASAPPVIRYNRLPKVYYAAQVAGHPPTVALVTNGPDLFEGTYLRYLTKTLRDSGPFGEVPIKMILRTRGDTGGGGSKVPVAADEDGTDIIPALADEPEMEEIPVPRKKKKNPDTWDV